MTSMQRDRGGLPVAPTYATRRQATARLAGPSALGLGAVSLCVLALGGSTAGCTRPRGNSGGACLPGQTTTCACAGGGTGSQACTTSRVFGSCMCGDSATGPVDGAILDDAGLVQPTDSGIPIDRDGGPLVRDSGPRPTEDGGSAAGFCTNPGDRSASGATYGPGTIEEVAASCGIGCLSETDLRTCIAACIDGETAGAFSASCRDCYVDTTLCAAESCVPTCVIDPWGVSCTDCRCGGNTTGRNCVAEFDLCSGFETFVCSP